MAKRKLPTRRQRLEHINEAIDKLLSFTEDVDYEEFHQDEIKQLAIIKLFEIIGEATYHLDKEFKKENDHIEWAKMEGLRHILVHEYYRVDIEILWNTKELFLNDLGNDIADLL
ncbi:MAG: HepT-like ribonuclease domain-containing protein, partial [Bacteroidota bacterium]